MNQKLTYNSLMGDVFDEIMKAAIDLLDSRLKEHPDRPVTIKTALCYKKIGDDEYILIQEDKKDDETQIFPIEISGFIENDELKQTIFFPNSGNSFKASKPWESILKK